MNYLQVFNFNNATVRTIELNGEILFVGKDIAEVLGYSAPSKAVIDHCKGITKMVIPSENGGDQETNMIPERDLYRLIMRSRLPEAEKFEDWVVGEVLPSIRKTGSYSVSNNPIDVLSTAQKAIHVYKDIAELFGLKGNPALISANVATRKDTGIDFQARLGITLLSENNERILTPTEIGAQIGKTAREVNKMLIENLYQTKIGKMYLPTSIGESYSVLIDSGKKNSNGAMIQQLKWKEAILNLLTSKN